METDEAKIKAITEWVNNHSKVDRPLPKIGMKYLNDLLEYIEDFRMLEKQAEIDKSRELIRKEYERKLKTQKGIMPYLIKVPLSYIFRSLWLRIWK